MLQTWLASRASTGPALFALVLFLAIFAIAVARALRPGARARHEALARMPLEDDAPPRAGAPRGGVHG